ncbi:MAG: LptF/LptG family permease, partial [Akkermansia sp.]|nr:LptF/LptG family permease [Akkermansia sp.]
MSILRNSLPAVILFLLGSLLAWYLVPIELEQMRWEVPGMPETYPIEQLCRPIFLGLLCYLPFIGAVFYAFMGTMDRYMSRNFITYFLMCTLILLLIYILADFTDNMERFRTRFEDPLIQALGFYGTQLPMFLYQILPYTLLMGTLWCLSKLCGGSEITGMLQSGRSLLRVCMPIFLLGSLVALGYGICGFHWAPNGSMYREMVLKRNKNADGSAKPIVYRSDATSRIWRIEKPPFITDLSQPMRIVNIDQFDSEVRGKLLKQYRAESAVWNKEESTWTFTNVYVREMSAPGTRP